VSYLWRLVGLGCAITLTNYEQLSATLVLMSSKMNEIHPPKMGELRHCCTQSFSREEMTMV
jgi:hypothetical protein